MDKTSLSVLATANDVAAVALHWCASIWIDKEGTFSQAVSIALRGMAADAQARADHLRRYNDDVESTTKKD